MPSGHGERYDFFLSRRGSVAAVAREVADVLTEKGYRVLVQDYDIPFSASFTEAMHEGIKNSRDLLVLYTNDYEQSPFTRKEFTSFEAERAQSAEERHIVVLRCEDVPLRGLLADNVYQDLVGIAAPEERKRRIIAAAERQSQAAAPPPRPFIGVPPRIASFTGRADELDRLDAILMHDKPAAVTQAVGRAAVQGMGGVGKTSLAIEYAHRYRNLYAGVCWCLAETRTGFLSSLAILAVSPGATVADEADAEKAAKAALRRLAEQRSTWLLVYDNVSSPDEIAEFLPSAGARLLITSRFADWSEWAEEIALDVLSLEEAIAFLQSRTGRRDAAGAKTLAEALGCLPLALDHAAAYCKRTQMRFADYAAKASSLIAAAPRGVGYPRSVAATFDLAIAEAVTQCQAAEMLMAYLAQCAPERIPMTLVDGVNESEIERLQALAALTEVSLVKHDPFEDGTPAVVVHRLVQAAARARSETHPWSGTSAAFRPVERMIKQLAASYPREQDAFSDPRKWLICAHLTPHLLAVRKAKRVVSSIERDWADLLNRAGAYLHGRASYQEAEPLFRDALAIREKVAGPKHPDTATSLNNLARLLQDEGALAEARPLFERALQIDANVYGLNYPETATIQSNLALLLQAQGDFAGSQPLLKDALATREAVLGREHPLTATTLNNLALALHAQGDVTGARPLFERSLTICHDALGDEHPNTSRARRNLALLLLQTGDASNALTLSKTALTAHDKALGRTHVWTKDSACVTADALGALGRTDEAAALRERYGLAGPEDPKSL
jgi:tetratricopeptide (TPR) repeat protein